MSEPAKPDLRSIPQQELGDWLSHHNEPSYRLEQLWRALHMRGVVTWNGLTDLPQRLRQVLAEEFILTPAKLIRSATATDGTMKLLLEYDDAVRVECVALPHDDHITACLSVQSGCSMGCKFCNTALLKKGRNLTPFEIEEQFHLLTAHLGAKPRNIVFMGMGEPLDNFDGSVGGARLLGDTQGADVGFRRITFSTVGLAPQIRQLADEEPRVKLALSLGSPFQKQREQLMPIAKRYPLAKVVSALQYHAKRTGRKPTIEYLLLAGVNDTLEHAEGVLRLLEDLSCKINLIAYNPSERIPYKRPSEDETVRFLEWLRRGPHAAMLRRSKGNEVQAACGQLAGEG